VKSQDRADILKAYEGYLEAFSESDVEAIDTYIHYPLAYIGADAVTLLDKFPINPAELKELKGWDGSEALEIDVVAAGESKAHLILRNARRLRADGSLIEEATGFYAYTRTSAGWKMFAISDIVFPA
jgi:hypothetical protein